MNNGTTEMSRRFPIGLRGSLLCLLLVLFNSAVAAAEGPGFFAHGLTDLQYAYSDSEQSWLKRGPDKLRFDENDRLDPPASSSSTNRAA